MSRKIRNLLVSFAFLISLASSILFYLYIRGFALDLCGYPEKEEIILTPEETVKKYQEHREALDKKMDDKLAKIISLLEV